MEKLNYFFSKHELKIMSAIFIVAFMVSAFAIGTFIPDFINSIKSIIPVSAEPQIIVEDTVNWKNLDEDERVIKAINLGGDTTYLNKREIQLYNEVVNFVNSVKGKSEYEIALSAHDLVCEKTTYDKTVDTENNILTYGYDSASSYGALISNYTVCAGYARAYRLLLSAC